MNSIQKKVAREKQRYSNLLDEYHKLQSSQLTDKPSQLDTSQREDHDKSEELQTSRSLDEDTMTELTKLQLKMEDVSVSLEKVDTIKKYWEQVCMHIYSINHWSRRVSCSTRNQHATLWVYFTIMRFSCTYTISMHVFHNSLLGGHIIF